MKLLSNDCHTQKKLSYYFNTYKTLSSHCHTQNFI